MTKIRSILTIVAVIAATFVITPSSSAQDEVPDVQPSGPSRGCSGDHTGFWPGVGFGLSHVSGIFATPNKPPSQRTISVKVPAGSYDVTAESYDGYDTRVSTPPQLAEQYFLEFLASGGDVIATTGVTSDLADGVIEANASTPVGSIVLSVDAVEVRATHRFAGQVAAGTQSVQPSCFGATLIPPPTTTSEAPPPTTTSEAPPPTTTTEAPPTTTEAPATTTTTVATQVLPEVQVADPADPVAATPTFTG